MNRDFSVSGIRGVNLSAWLQKALERSPRIFGMNYYERVANKFYDYLDAGRFDGSVRTLWNGVDSNNRDNFIYEGDLVYTDNNGRVIQPPAGLDTDMGSIPKLLRGIDELTPWRYAPGYIIHDWLFVAHKENIHPDNDFTFLETAYILAECMKTQMEIGFMDHTGSIQKTKKNPRTVLTVFLAVSSPLALRVWNSR
jgi:hypothetical protein